MKVARRFGLTGSIAAAAIFFGSIWAASDSASDLAESYFTEAQVERAEAVYSQSCASCHGNNLGGSASAPPLVGLPFLFFWEGKYADELFEYLQETMPLDRPGSLTDQEYADLVALILMHNEFPGGEEEFPSDVESMQNYLLELE